MLHSSPRDGRSGQRREDSSARLGAEEPLCRQAGLAWQDDPFLTAVKEGPEATSDMLHEMATRGVAMAVLLGVVWVAMVGISTWLERSKAAVPQQEA